MHSSSTQTAFAAGLALALAAMPARAVDVSGYVITKSGAPISLAKVCVKSDASKCVTTDLMGTFHITTTNAIRESDPRTSPYSMDFRNGVLSLEAPMAGEVKVEWAGPGGRSLSMVEGLRVARGRNVLAVPKGLPENGICFLRLSASGRTFTWKAVMMQGAGSGRSPAGSPTPSASGRIAALAKAAGTSTLEISKTGYRTRIYEPFEDPETGAIIAMSTTDDVGLNFTGSFTAKILAINRTAKTVIVENVDAYCDSSNVKRDTTRDTSLYAFVGGKFWLWGKGECTGQVFTTTSTDPVGTFTLLDPAAELPADLKAGCKPDGGGGDSPFESFNATYKVTETQLSGDITVELCPADFYGPFFADFLFLDTNVTLTKNTCKQLIFKNKAGESGTLDFSKKGDSLQFDFTYKTEKCTAAQDFTLSDKEPVCPEDSGSVEGFLFCMLGSGFLDTAAIAGAPPAAKTTAAGPVANLGAPVANVRWPMSREVARKPTDPVRRGSIFPWHGWGSKAAKVR